MTPSCGAGAACARDVMSIFASSRPSYAHITQIGWIREKSVSRGGAQNKKARHKFAALVKTPSEDPLHKISNHRHRLASRRLEAPL
jgi:hypothetical protein